MISTNESRYKWGDYPGTRREAPGANKISRILTIAPLGAFIILPALRVVFDFSPLGRDQFGQRYQREFLLFYKKRRNQRGAILSLLWLLIGLYLEAIVVSITVFKISPLTGTFKGMIEGIRQQVLPLNT